MNISERKLGAFVLIGLAIYFFGFNYLPSIVLALLFWALFPAACLFVFRGWKKSLVTQPHETESFTEGAQEKK